MSSITRIVASVDQLPSLGEVFHELDAALRDPDHTAGQLSSIAARDVGLTTEIYRLVNSSFFGLEHRVESLPQAVAMVGADSLRNLVAVGSLIRPDDRTDVDRIRNINEHSLATGALAAFTRRSNGATARESADAFTAGLLHEVGALVLARVPELDGPAAWSVLDQDDVALERETFGAHRFAIAAHLFAKWGFDLELAEAIGGLGDAEVVRRDSLGGSLRIAHHALVQGAVRRADVLAGDHDTIRPTIERIADELDASAAPTPTVA